MGSWIGRAASDRRARVRLVCLPHAGVGGAVYRAWPRALPAALEVCAVTLPGRAHRLSEEPFRRVSELVREAARGLAPHLGERYALFGHSLGACVVFELARELRRLGHGEPLHLFVSGLRAPHLKPREAPIWPLPEEAFVAEVQRRYDAIPAAVLAEPEMLRLTLPALRADFELLETYVYEAGPPLTCPLSAFGGEGDARVSEEELLAWQEHTTSRFRMRRYPGGHFYLEVPEVRAQLLEALWRELDGGPQEAGS